MANGKSLESRSGLRGGEHATCVLLISIVGLLTFVNVCWNGFVWEDDHQIANNRAVREVTNIPSFFTATYWQMEHPLKHSMYRPLPMATFAIDHALWGLRPGGYHLTNLACHLVASVLAYFVCLSVASGRRVALVAGLLFTVHPVHVEPTAWAKCRPELLAAIGIFAGFIAFRRSIVAKAPWGSDGVGYWVVSLLAAVSAYFCKQNALVLPAVLSGYLWYRKGTVDRESRNATVAKLAAHWLIAFTLGAWCVVPSSATLKVGFTQHHPAAHGGVGTVLITMLTYLRLAFFPVLLNADRMFPSVVRASIAEIAIGFVVLCLTVRVLWVRRPSAFWVFWATVFFLPVSNVVFLGGRPIAEQRLYVPSLALCALAGLGVELVIRRFHQEGRAAALALAGPVVWLTVSAPIAIERNAAWRESRVFWTATLRCSPSSFQARRGMAIAYAKTKDSSRAIRLFERAGRLKPKSPDIPYNIGAVLLERGRLADAEKQLHRAAELGPELAMTYSALGALYERQRKYAEAVKMFSKAIELNPRNARAYSNLAGAQARIGRVDEAEANYQHAIRLDPSLPEPHCNLGCLYLQIPRLRDAEAHLLKAIDLKADYAEAYANLGLLWYACRDLGRAESVCRRAIRLSPDSWQPSLTLARILEAKGQTREAQERYGSVLRLSPGNAEAEAGLKRAQTGQRHVGASAQ